MKTLAQLNKEVWEEYEKTKKPACQYIARNGYKIVQCECSGANGTTYVHLEDDLHTDIVINWQACGNTIYVTKVTDKVIKFLIDEIFVTNPDSLGAFYIFGADGVDDSLENFLKKSTINIKTASYDEGLEASQNLAYLTYEYGEIINAVDWGNWNFTKSFYNTCKSK